MELLVGIVVIALIVACGIKWGRPLARKESEFLFVPPMGHPGPGCSCGSCQGTYPLE